MAGNKNNASIGFEPVVIGEDTTRISRTIFFLLCLVPVLSTILFGGVDNGTWILLSVIMAAVFLLWLAEEWYAGGFFLNTQPIQIPIAGLILVGLIQLLPLGTDISGGLLKFPASAAISLDPYSTRIFVAHLVVYLIFLAACLIFINSAQRVNKVAMMMVVFGSAMAFFGILQRLGNPEAIYGLRETPQAIPFGPFVNQHHFAAFMQLTSGVTFGLMIGKNVSRDHRLLLVIAMILMGVATVFTSSRGGLLGLVSVVAFVTILNLLGGRKSSRQDKSRGDSLRARVMIALAAASLLLLIFGVVLILGGNDLLLRGIGMSTAEADISNGRAHFWPIAIQIFLSHPIFGAGFDAFGMAFTKFDTWNGNLRIEQAHNDYLQTLADSGIAGFICVASFIFLLFKRGFANIARTENSYSRDIAIGALAGCFGILIHSFFDFPLRTPSNAFFFLMLSAIAVNKLPSAIRASRNKT